MVKDDKFIMLNLDDERSKKVAGVLEEKMLAHKTSGTPEPTKEEQEIWTLVNDITKRLGETV